MKVKTIEVGYKASLDYNTAEARFSLEVEEGDDFEIETIEALAKAKTIARKAVEQIKEEKKGVK